MIDVSVHDPECIRIRRISGYRVLEIQTPSGVISIFMEPESLVDFGFEILEEMGIDTSQVRVPAES